MDWNKIKYIIDIGLIITFFSSFVTGLIKFPGLFQFVGISDLVLPMLQVNLLHEWSGIIMGLLVLMHLILNRKWLFVMTKEILGLKK